MRKFILPMFDVMVYGSFAAFLCLMAASVPADARMRLLSGLWDVLRQTGGL
ncbi:MAG: hypothetical protein RDU30_16040 [Desulfovibrionaceae bacterium]|nr:hypothetical protein [Desulfovibrionaceae bacterium]